MRVISISVIPVTLFLFAATVRPQEPTFRMKSAAKFSDDQAEVLIIGGTKADPDDWPATFIFANPSGGACTSTAVGGRAILTAAHCIPDGATGIVEFEAQSITTTCYHHPDYHDNVADSDPKWAQKVSPDFALCSLSADLKGIEFENIDANGNVLHEGGTVRLVGFGCNKVGGSDKGFGVLYEGDAAISELAAPPSYYTSTLGGAAVCYGDSGGAAYVFTNPAKTRRVGIGVNSRGNISTLSLLSTTSVPGFISWAKKWASDHNAHICGLHDAAQDCRAK